MLFSRSVLAALGFGAASAAPASLVSTISSSTTPPTATTVNNLPLIAELKTDASQAQRFQQLLANNGQPLTGDALAAATIFDFAQGGTVVPGTAGGTLNPAGPKNWPILTDGGLAFNLLTLGPCGFFAPHIHPRANELFLVLEGEVNFGYILEATVFGGLTAPNPTINGTLKVQQGTLFPMGSTHWQINASPTCNNATTFEAFSSDDEGAIIILNHVTNDDRVISPTMNENDLGGLRAVLPPAILAEVDSCLARCNIHNDN